MCACVYVVCPFECGVCVGVHVCLRMCAHLCVSVVCVNVCMRLFVCEPVSSTAQSPH